MRIPPSAPPVDPRSAPEPTTPRRRAEAERTRTSTAPTLPGGGALTPLPGANERAQAPAGQTLPPTRRQDPPRDSNAHIASSLAGLVVRRQQYRPDELRADSLRFADAASSSSGSSNAPPPVNAARHGAPRAAAVEQPRRAPSDVTPLLVDPSTGERAASSADSTSITIASVTTRPPSGDTSRLSLEVGATESSPPEGVAAPNSWRSTVEWMVNRLAAGASALASGAAASQLASGVRTHLAALGAAVPAQESIGAAAGHFVHQVVSVGIPMVVREMMAEAIVLAARNMPPDHVMALQLTSGIINVGLQVYRRTLEDRNPEAATRGFHALSEAQWAALPTPEREKLHQEQLAHSRLLTNLQIAGTATTFMVGMAASRSGDPALAETPAKLLATDLKSTVYAAMRDMLQASFSMVRTDGVTTGVSGAPLRSAAGAYAAVAAGANYGFSYLPGLVPDAANASGVLRGTSTALSRGAAWQVRAEVAAVKAAINVALQSFDWAYMGAEEAKQAGTTERWTPRLRILDPASQDYARIKDQVPARIALISGGNALVNLLSVALRNQPEWLNTAAGNFADAAYAGLSYKSVAGTWQAQAAVRAQPDPSIPPTSERHGRES